ncbi:MAG: hypothetical protein U0228_23200 [Myxococcaceae bacterium]
MSSAILLLALLAAPADAPVPDEPGLHFVAQVDVVAGARAGNPPGAPFVFGGDLLLGFRFDPVRFGVMVGVAAARAPVDFGGFFSVDLVRVKLDSQRTVALFTMAEVASRYSPSAMNPFSLVLLGEVGVRALGISLGVVGGAEIPGGLGDGEVRLGVDFVELLSLL